MADVNKVPSPSIDFAYSVYLPANLHISPHTHPYHEMVLVQRGRFRSLVDQRVYVLHPGDVIVYPTGCQHEEWAEDNKPVMTWACGFRWDGLAEGLVAPCRDSRSRIQELLAWLAMDFHEKREGRSTGEDMPAILQTILAEIKRLKKDEPNAMVEQIRHFVRRNLANPFTLDDLARITTLSKWHFVRQFKEQTGRTPMEDVRLLRVEEAKRLICTTSLLLSDIAPMVGVANEFHLSRLLKKVLGVNVRDLRPNLREQ